MRILLIEDDELLGNGIKRGLDQEADFTVEWLKEGNGATRALHDEHFDIVLLDINLPGRSGLEVLRQLRQGPGPNQLVPVILLTARDTIDDRVTGLNAGADDYVTKPFDLIELKARLRALQRRATNRAQTLIQHNLVTLDPIGRTVLNEGKPINLPRREYSILELLMLHPGEVVSREKLTQTLYGWGEEVDSNTLEVHMHNLRKKFNSLNIRTIRGVGYMLEKTP